MWEKKKEIREWERRGFAILNKQSKSKKLFLTIARIPVVIWILVTTFWCTFWWEERGKPWPTKKQK